jgi:MFS family permease
LPRYYLLAGLTDFALYVVLTAAPHQALDFNATTFQLSLIPVFWAVPYVLVTSLGGGLCDRFPRDHVARLGAMLFAMAAAIQAGAQGLERIYASVTLVGIGLGLFWPALQAAIADASFHRTLEKNLGAFNVAWSLGKALGFLAGGSLYALLGAEPTVALASGVACVVAFGIPRAPRIAGELTSLTAETDLSPAERRRWRFTGWIANFGAWGLGATVIHLYPQMNQAHGRGAEVYGVILTVVYLSQTAAFWGLRRWRGWVYRLAPLVAVQAIGAGLVLVVGLSSHVVVLAVAAAGIGLSLGMGYYASITYSLRTDRGRGRNTGLHEAVLGSANFLLPFAGGSLAHRTGEATAPYLLAAGVVAAAIAIQVLGRRLLSTTGRVPEPEKPGGAAERLGE